MPPIMPANLPPLGPGMMGMGSTNVCPLQLLAEISLMPASLETGLHATTYDANLLSRYEASIRNLRVYSMWGLLHLYSVGLASLILPRSFFALTPRLRLYRYPDWARKLRAAIYPDLASSLKTAATYSRP